MIAITPAYRFTLPLILSLCLSCASLASKAQVFKERTWTGKDLNLTYWDEGEGIPLVFLHGWSSDKGYWRNQVEALSENYRVIAVDWRGQGNSGGGQQTYRFNHLIADLSLFLDSLLLEEKPVLIGHSMGGVQVMHYAAEFPDKVDNIVVVDAPGKSNLVTGKLMYWAMRFAFFATGFLDDEISIALHVPINRYLFYSNLFAETNPKHINRWENQFKSNSINSLNHSLHALTYRERLSSPVQKVSAMFVLGSEDRFIDLEQTQQYQSLFPGSQIKMIEGAGHMSSEEQPEIFNQLIRSFLALQVDHPTMASVGSD